MKIKNLIRALKSFDKITEGVLNTIFTKEEVEKVAKERFNICKNCKELDNQGVNCFAPGTQPCCSDCGCSLKFKTRSLSSSCPQDKWGALITEEQEELLTDTTDDD